MQHDFSGLCQSAISLNVSAFTIEKSIPKMMCLYWCISRNMMIYHVTDLKTILYDWLVLELHIQLYQIQEIICQIIAESLSKFRQSVCRKFAYGMTTIRTSTLCALCSLEWLKYYKFQRIILCEIGLKSPKETTKAPNLGESTIPNKLTIKQMAGKGMHLHLNSNLSANLFIHHNE